MAEPRTRLLALGLVGVLVLGACSSDGDGDGSEATASSSTTSAAGVPPSSTLAVTTTTGPSSTTVPAPEPLEDQSPPEAVNGLTVDGDTLWVASVNSDQVIQVDRETGAILTRVEAPGSSPDDVAVGPDGAVYWTGFGSGFPSGVTASAEDPDGVIHVLSANGVVWTFDEGTGSVEPAVTLEPAIYDNLAFAPDGTLYITHFTEPVITVVDTDGTQTALATGS